MTRMNADKRGGGTEPRVDSPKRDRPGAPCGGPGRSAVVSSRPGSEPAEVGGDDADTLAEAELLDHLGGGRDGHALVRRDADAGEDLRGLLGLALADAEDRQAVEDQRRG